MTDKELLDLYRGCVFSGQISEIHIKSMERYPFVFFEGVTEAKLSYDIVLDPNRFLQPTQNSFDLKKSKVSYSLGMSSNLPEDQKKTGIEHLKKSLSTIFFQDVEVEVDFHE